jgi:hypothetical protein
MLEPPPVVLAVPFKSAQGPRTQYNVFISHAWDYNDEYERVIDFLNDFNELDWQNHSVSLDDPLDTVNDAHLRSQLGTRYEPLLSSSCSREYIVRTGNGFRTRLN